MRFTHICVRFVYSRTPYTANKQFAHRNERRVYTIYRKIGIRLDARVDYMYRKYSYNRKICDEFRTLYFRRLCALLSSAKHSPLSPKWKEREKWARTTLINISFRIRILKELVHCISARSWYRTHSFCVANQTSVFFLLKMLNLFPIRNQSLALSLLFFASFRRKLKEAVQKDADPNAEHSQHSKIIEEI